MVDSKIFIVLSSISLVLSVGAIMIIFLTLYKLRGMKIQIFQKYVIFQYLFIFLIQVILTSTQI